MKLVNENQTKEERKEKYWLVRSHSIPAKHARQMRDWHLTQIEKRLGYIEKILGRIQNETRHR